MSAEIARRAAGKTALLVIDMITDLDFAQGAAIRDKAEALAGRIAALAAQARMAGVPVVYVNDNYGQWHSERSRLIAHCLRPDSRGRDVVRRLLPQEDDYFVIKPQFSGFYATNLPVLLPKLGASRLILTGIAADMCVLFTAADAHMRDYALWVPADCVASASDDHAGWALESMRSSMEAQIADSGGDALARWIAAGERDG